VPIARSGGGARSAEDGARKESCKEAGKEGRKEAGKEGRKEAGEESEEVRRHTIVTEPQEFPCGLCGNLLCDGMQ